MSTFYTSPFKFQKPFYLFLNVVSIKATTATVMQKNRRLIQRFITLNDEVRLCLT